MTREHIISVYVLISYEFCRCDRILWYGKGMKQVAYTSGDLKLSDHRSVCATFIAEVEVVNPRKLKKACIYPKNITVGQLKAKEVSFGAFGAFGAETFSGAAINVYILESCFLLTEILKPFWYRIK